MSCPLEISKISNSSSREMSERNGDVNSVIYFIESESTKILFKINLKVLLARRKPKKSEHIPIFKNLNDLDSIQ